MSAEPILPDDEEFDEPTRIEARLRRTLILTLFGLFFGSLVAGIILGDVFENYQNATNL